MFNFIDSLKSVAAWRRMQADEEGATAVEYGIMVALIAAVIIVAVGLLGENVNGAFEFINDQLTGG